MRPFVSVLTPTYNRRPFLPALITTYKQQTYPLTSMEWIILDDGTDSVEDIFTAAAQTIPNLRYIRLTEKLSIGAKRNRLNQEAKGDILVAMDDDDFYAPERVTHVVHRFQQSPTTQLAGSSELHFYFHDLKTIYKFGPIHKNHATNGTLAYRRAYALTHRYDESLSHAEEPSFLDDYKHPMIQLDPFKTMLVFCHSSNTYDKRQMIDTNPLMKKTALKVKQFITHTPTRNMFLELWSSVSSKESAKDSKDT